MTIHNKLPDERPSIIHKFTVAGLEGYATVSCYDDGTPAELFLTVHQVGGLERGMASALAIMISVALQHGVPMTKITEKLRGMSFEPQGPTSNKAIPWAKSLADYLGKWLESRFPAKLEGEPK